MKKDYLHWTLYSISIIITVIFFVSIFNYKIDSLSLFGEKKYLKQAATSLIEGKMVAGLKNYDDRLFQKYLIESFDKKMDVIAIGSSRTMQLRKSFFLNDTLNYFNHSVSGASLEDYISIIGLYKELHNRIPQTIVLGIDPWIFNENNEQTRWKTLEEFYNKSLNNINNNIQFNENNFNLVKFKQLVNYSYTLENIKFLYNLIQNNEVPFYTTNTIHIDDTVKEIDGSFHYPNKQRFQSEEDVKKLAVEYATSKVYALERFTKLSNKNLFESFLNYLVKEGVRVIIFLPPYNPVSYDIFSKKVQYQTLFDVEEYLIKIADEYNLTLIGSYNPHKYNLKNSDFFDGMHANETVLSNLFKGLKNE